MPVGVYERKLKPISVRLFAKVVKEPEDNGCWLWTGCTSIFGHGQIWNGTFKSNLGQRRLLTAHRVSYELHYGVDPGLSCVLHRCDVPNCVRPDHLFLGTKKDNTDDMRAKNRMVVGEAHPRAKLTTEKVIAIRLSKEPHSVLCKRFGVSLGLISLIQNRKKWRHVP